MWKAEKPVHILIHLGIIAGIILTISFLFFQIYLPFTTNHNQRIVVPVLEGKSIEETNRIIEEAGLRIHINDSSYVEGKMPNMVISQHPEAGSEVKKNRKIYLTITSSAPPKVKMPKLVDLSLKGAELSLKSFDLKLGKVEYINSPYKDLVIEQSLSGQEISAGTYIPKGSRIDLKIGNGESNKSIELPELKGLKKEEAINLIESLGLKTGIVAFDPDSDLSPGLVSKQSPDPIISGKKTVESGAVIDLWISE